MDSLKAVQRHLMLQQRWVKLCCVAVVLVTLLALLLGTVGNDSAQIRATGMGAFTEEDVSKYNLGNHVSARRVNFEHFFKIRPVLMSSANPAGPMLSS